MAAAKIKPYRIVTGTGYKDLVERLGAETVGRIIDQVTAEGDLQRALREPDDAEGEAAPDDD